jgi:hypothetical protein
LSSSVDPTVAELTRPIGSLKRDLPAIELFLAKGHPTQVRSVQRGPFESKLWHKCLQRDAVESSHGPLDSGFAEIGEILPCMYLCVFFHEGLQAFKGCFASAFLHTELSSHKQFWW